MLKPVHKIRLACYSAVQAKNIMKNVLVIHLAIMENMEDSHLSR